MLNMSIAAAPQLHSILRHRIIRNDLEPGTRISEPEIAQAYGVSRQPVREAFIKLAEEGLVEIRPQRGTFVRRIEVCAVMDARFVREAIEADIVKELCYAADTSLARELQTQVATQQTIASRDFKTFYELDEIFHRTLAEAAGRTHAWRLIEGVKSQMDRVRYLSTMRLPMPNLIAQHGQIADAISAANGDAAQRAMREHLRAILTDLPAIVRERPNYFDSAPDDIKQGR